MTADDMAGHEQCGVMASLADFGGNAEPCVLPAGHDFRHANGRIRWSTSGGPVPDDAAGRIRAWLARPDRAVPIGDIRTLLDEREQLRARLDHIDILLPVLTATVDYGPTLENARRAVATIARALDNRAATIAAMSPTAEPEPCDGDCDCQPGQPCLCPERDCYCGPCPVCGEDPQR